MVAIITVSYQKSNIAKLLESLSKQKNNDFKLYIVDISGTPDEFPNLHKSTTVLRRANLGYSNAINEGIKQATKDAVELFCVINDDTYVGEEFVQSIHRSLLANSNSLIGGKIYYAPGYEHHKDRYVKKDLGKVLWYAGGSVDWDHAQPKHRGVDEVDKKQFDKVEATEFITGCLMMFDKKVIDKLGYWDESYFLYYEDADYCERAKRSKLKLIYDPSLMVWHMTSQSTGGSGSDLHKKYQSKNLVKFALKYAPWRTKLHVLKNYFFR